MSFVTRTEIIASAIRHGADEITAQHVADGMLSHQSDCGHTSHPADCRCDTVDMDSTDLDALAAEIS